MRHVHVEKERRHDVMLGKSCDEKNVKGKACLFKDGKPLDCLATPPKERYINSVDADLLCLGVFRRGNIENLWAHEGAREGRSPYREKLTCTDTRTYKQLVFTVGACIDLGLDFE